MTERRLSRILSENPRYFAQAGARVAFYAFYERAMRERAKPFLENAPKPATPQGPIPSQRELFAGIAQLFAKDARNIKQGLYRAKRGPYKSAGELLAAGRAFLEDVPEVARRRAEQSHQEVGHTDPTLPRYYQQNFHFQTDGWLSDHSAQIYDFQVEVLFKGTTAAMRRQGLAVLAQLLKQRDQRRLAYADIAVGTGGLLHPALYSFPALKGIGVDLSLPYLKAAQTRFTSKRAAYVCANAEHLPFADNSLDVVSCVYLFHELPPKVRRSVAKEIGRVLKPDGHVIFVDSLQLGDTPSYDGLLELFPALFHEPYYSGYLREDLRDVFAEARLDEQSVEPAFFSRIAHYTKR